METRDDVTYVDCTIWKWEHDGMKTTRHKTAESYVLVGDVERLLQDAHERGKTQGIQIGVDQTVEKILAMRKV